MMVYVEYEISSRALSGNSFIKVTALSNPSADLFKAIRDCLPKMKGLRSSHHATLVVLHSLPFGNSREEEFLAV